MDPFTQDELESIVQAMSHKKLTDEEGAKIPLRPPGNYKKIAKVDFSPILGEYIRPMEELTAQEMQDLQSLHVEIEVTFGKTRLSLKELAAIEKGSLLPLNELCDDLVDIFVNGKQIGRGEVVVVDNHFGVKIVAFTKN